MSNQSNSISRDTVKLTAAKGLNALVLFGGTALFTRVIGADELGIFFLFERLLALFVVFSNFGLSGALEKRLSEDVDEEQFLATAALMKAVLIVVLGAIIFAAQGRINRYLGAELAVLLIIALAVREAGRLFLGVLRGERRVGETAYLLAARRLCWVGVGVALALTGLGHLAPLYGFIIGLVAVLLLGYLLARTQFGRPSLDHAKSLFAFSKYDFISSSVGWQVYNSLDTLLIGFFLTTVAVTHYEIAWRISTVVMMVTASISKVIFPSFSKYVVDDQPERVTRVTKWSLGAGLLVSIPALAGTIVVGEPLLRYGFGPGTTAASLVLIILVADKISHAIQEVLAQVVRAHDRPDICAAITGSSILVNGVGNYLLIPRYGILGAGIGTTGSFFFATVLYYIAARRFVVIRVPLRTVAWQIFSAGVMGGALLGLRRLYGIDSLVETMLFIGLGVVIYGGLTQLHEGTRTITRERKPESF